jgi:ApbE superfamily uncharacterized protein (UPF0280 family)
MPGSFKLGRGATAHLFTGNRLFLQQGPVNLIIKAFGSDAEVRKAYAQACGEFNGLLDELVKELPRLKKPLLWIVPSAKNTTAQAMVEAVKPFRERWVTPMAAVAGAISDQIARAMRRDTVLEKLFVNNGGDIALWVGPGQILEVGVVPSLARAVPEAVLRLEAKQGIRGIATSGWDGSSHSLGIADAVTVLAENAAIADAAATLIANEVNIEHEAIRRQPANELDPNSDLGTKLVTTAVGDLPYDLVIAALERGVSYANELIAEDKIKASLLSLKGEWRTAGQVPAPPPRYGRYRR